MEKTARDFIHEKLVKLSEVKTGLNDTAYLLLVIEKCIEASEQYATLKSSQDNKVLREQLGVQKLNFFKLKEKLEEKLEKLNSFSFNQSLEISAIEDRFEKLKENFNSNAVKFAEWLRTFDSLEKQHDYWVIESQISSEELYKLFLNNTFTKTNSEVDKLQSDNKALSDMCDKLMNTLKNQSSTSLDMWFKFYVEQLLIEYNKLKGGKDNG